MRVPRREELLLLLTNVAVGSSRKSLRFIVSGYLIRGWVEEAIDPVHQAVPSGRPSPAPVRPLAQSGAVGPSCRPLLRGVAPPSLEAGDHGHSRVRSGSTLFRCARLPLLRAG